ncbi:MAG: hypothetical protein AAF219_10810 [Myxococcota bacterium]
MQEIYIELDRCESAAGLLSAVATRLVGAFPHGQDWIELEKLISVDDQTQQVLLSGLARAEKMWPEAVEQMLALFRRLNSRGDGPRYRLEIADEYDPIMWFVQARVAREAVDDTTKEQAFVSCWVKQRSEEAARTIVFETLLAESWTVQEVVVFRITRREDFNENPEDDEFYQQALVDGAVFVFDSWPE